MMWIVTEEWQVLRKAERRIEISVETLKVIDRAIGWHYEVVPTDALSKCEPFCLPMPLTEKYVKQCEMEIVDNPELLKKNGKTVRQNIFDILEA